MAAAQSVRSRLGRTARKRALALAAGFTLRRGAGIVRRMRFESLLLAFACASSAFAVTQTVIVDVIPTKLNKEHQQNSEPNIAVNPANPQQILLSAFGSGLSNNQVYFSNDGGTTWKLFQYTTVGDQTLAWSDAGIAYIAELSPSASRIFVGKQKKPTAKKHKFRILPKSNFNPSQGGPDQPWIDAITVDGTDRIYVSFNDLSQAAKTASVRFSLDSGKHWQNEVVEHVTPGAGFNLPPARVKASGNTVYVAFERPATFDGFNDPTGDVVIVRDDAGGVNGFNAIGAGVVIAGGVTIPFSSIGSERIGSDVSVAIDPGNAQRVAVGYALVVGGTPRVVLSLSTNGGANWLQVFVGPPNSAMAAAAIAANGTVGLLYTALVGANLETHFVQSTNSFATNFEQLLSRFPDGNPAVTFEPYIGDYIDLVAVGNTFYGTFSASNDVSLFPITPTFVRDQSKLGDTVDFSIDPFFFTTPALAP